MVPRHKNSNEKDQPTNDWVETEMGNNSQNDLQLSRMAQMLQILVEIMQKIAIKNYYYAFTNFSKKLLFTTVITNHNK